MISRIYFNCSRKKEVLGRQINTKNRVWVIVKMGAGYQSSLYSSIFECLKCFHIKSESPGLAKV